MSNTDRPILVTGAAGFIGSHLARRLLGVGHEVVVVDNLSTGKLENVPETWLGRDHPLVFKGATSSPSPVFARALPSDFGQLFNDTHSKSSRKNLLRKERHLHGVVDSAARLVALEIFGISTPPLRLHRHSCARVQFRYERVDVSDPPRVHVVSVPPGHQRCLDAPETIR